MDMGGKDDTETAKRNEEALNFHSDNMSADWQLNGANLASVSMGMIPNSNPMTDSFCPAIWDRSINSVNLGFRDANVLPGLSGSNLLGSGTVGFEPARGAVDRNVGMFWTQPNAMLKGGMFLPTASGMLPQSLPQFPPDSDFIERAARLSSFSGGNLCDPINPFNTTESMNPYAKGVMPTQKPQEVFVGNELKSAPAIHYQDHEMTNVAESSKDGSLPIDGAAEGSRPRNDTKNENTFEAKQCVEGSVNESDEPECSSPGDQEVSEGAGQESPSKGLASKKRKRGGRVLHSCQVFANTKSATAMNAHGFPKNLLQWWLYILILFLISLFCSMLILIKIRELLHDLLKPPKTKLQFSKTEIKTCFQHPKNKVEKMVNRGPKLRILLKKNTFMFGPGEARQQIAIVLQNE